MHKALKYIHTPSLDGGTLLESAGYARDEWICMIQDFHVNLHQLICVDFEIRFRLSDCDINGTRLANHISYPLNSCRIKYLSDKVYIILSLLIILLIILRWLDRTCSLSYMRKQWWPVVLSEIEPSCVRSAEIKDIQLLPPLQDLTCRTTNICQVLLIAG